MKGFSMSKTKTPNINKTSIQKKSNPETIMDNMFVVFNQSFLIERIRNFIDDNGYTGKNKPKVLDVGCYNGRLWNFGKELFCYTRYVGIDYQQKYLDKTWNKQTPDLFELIQCDVTQGLPFGDEEFDMIVSSEVFEHIEEKHYDFILSEIWRVLKPGGRICLGFPMNTQGKKFHSVEKELDKLGHVNFPVHEDWEDLLSLKGFTKLRYDPSFSTSSSWRIPKEVKDNPMFQLFRERFGTRISRPFAMTVCDDHTGGGFYTYEKKV